VTEFLEAEITVEAELLQPPSILRRDENIDRDNRLAAGVSSDRTPRVSISC
jgi:hypothetical protein